MKKIKKQTVYNLSPLTITAQEPPEAAVHTYPHSLDPNQDIAPIPPQEPQDNTDPYPTDDNTLVAPSDNWTIAGITWQKKKWLIILLLLTLNLITLAAVAFKKK